MVAIAESAHRHARRGNGENVVADARQKRWLITGVSTGFGREMARIVLARGDKVVGTVRKPAQIEELKAEGIAAVLMDVNDKAQVVEGTAGAIAVMGGVDVLVNNAGYGQTGAIEALSDDDIRAVMETNFFGVLSVTRALIPELRSHGGTIVNISSMAGQIGFGGMGAYCASKFALEGMSEALAEELAPFGVRMIIVEPGAFRTDFSGRSIRNASGSVDAYAGTQAGEIGKRMGSYHGNEPGDPVKAIKAMIAAVDSDAPPLRLALGADAVQGIEAKFHRLRKDMDDWRETAIATAFDA
jgi:NAD(P)-dependent dehydrogenase (short-subunit alcohol dehydrogenase family)